MCQHGRRPTKCFECYRELYQDRTDQVRELAHELGRVTGGNSLRFARDQRGRLKLLHEHAPARERG